MINFQNVGNVNIQALGNFSNKKSNDALWSVIMPSLGVECGLNISSKQCEAAKLPSHQKKAQKICSTCLGPIFVHEIEKKHNSNYF